MLNVCLCCFHVQRDKDYNDPTETCFFRLMETMGLRVKYMATDGNCMFRSIADQIEGNTDHHHRYRGQIMDYIAANEEYFTPFIEDDETFEDYVSRMR